MTKCNYCHMQAIEKAAKKVGLTITKEKNNGGIRVTIDATPDPLGPTLPSEDGKTDKERTFVAWFAKLPSRCVC